MSVEPRGNTSGISPEYDPSSEQLPVRDDAEDLERKREQLLERMFPGSIEHEYIDRFAVLEQLGHGGMGAVYAAYDPALKRKVAIKQMLAPNDALACVRFEREAQAMARLTHPNVVQVYELLQFDGRPIIVMELVQGRTLRAWLQYAPRSRAEILEVFHGAGHGLAAAHRLGLVHRDFKPENLMIRDDGQSLVVDFGLVISERNPSLPAGAVIAALPTSVTPIGMLVGTPGYMAPEQSSGALVSASADQFSFCVALWEALHGARPFADTTADAVAQAIEDGALRRPQRGDVRSKIDEVLARGLQVHPTERFESMESLLGALDLGPRWRCSSGVCSRCITRRRPARRCNRTRAPRSR